MIRNRGDLARTPGRETALACVEAGIEAAHPKRILADELTLEGDTLRVTDTEYGLDRFERVLVLGGGNAAGHVAATLETILGDRIDGGAVVTDDPASTERVEMYAGDHPVPSERGVEGTRRVLELARSADETTLVLAVITGGGSALLPAPADDVTLTDLQAVTDALLASGAGIGELNAVRKHLSALKGGGLARTAAPATVVGVVLSDVVGNDLSVIASGPTAPDSSTFADAQRVLDNNVEEIPERVQHRITAGVAGSVPETPEPEDPVFERVTNHVLADNFTALAAARDVAASRGYDTLILSSRIRGEARAVAPTHTAIAEECRATGNPLKPPAVVLSGGEVTVTVRGDGTGGPNQEFALQAATDLDATDIALACVDTDGIDGATDAAGALVDGTTVDDTAVEALENNDVAPYLAARDELVFTGPTGTNVNDLRVLVIEN